MKSNLFIVGAPKAGTTFLYNILEQHRDIFIPKVKEPHFFTNKNIRPDWKSVALSIDDCNSYQKLYKNALGYKYLVDSSTSYLSDLSCAEKIYNYNKNANIIICIREPFQRIYSHYLMDIRLGIQSNELLFAYLEDKEKDALWGESYNYYKNSIYSLGIEKYLDFFGDNVKIILFDNLISNIDEVHKDILKWLDIDYQSFSHKINKNPHLVHKNNMMKFIASSSFLRNIYTSIPYIEKHKYIFKKIFFKTVNKPVIDNKIISIIRNDFTSEVMEIRRIMNNAELWKDTYE